MSEARDGGDVDQKVAFPIPLSLPSTQHKLGQSRGLTNICLVNKYLATSKIDSFVRAARGLTQEDGRGLISPVTKEHQWLPAPQSSLQARQSEPSTTSFTQSVVLAPAAATSPVSLLEM